MLRDNVVELAEQCTLGALMLAPGATTSVREWLRPEDFADLWHAQVYTAFLERHPVGGIDAESMGDVLVDRLGVRVANLPRVARLIAVTPPHPNPIAYARMVVEAGLRRQAAGLGLLLQAAAVNAALEHTARPLTATCSVVDAGLASIENRWAAATGQPVDDVVVPLHLRAAVRNTGLEARTAADRYLAAHPARDRDAEQAHVVTLVGMLIAHPDLVPAVSSWLPVSGIDPLGWRAVYGTTIAMTELGNHVDLTTVAWSLGELTHMQPHMPDLTQLRDAVDTGRLAYPPQVVRDVAADQVRKLADICANHLREAADTPGVLVGDLIDAGRTFTSALRTTATALPSQSIATRDDGRGAGRPTAGHEEVASR
ncbi:DnaB-like helicase N-terminal domain-containing protein [Cellulomonas sp. McL0617]|uniref:DnaB-like helicase N-terminal domain-containing protein n=1 Tax=Cellulomonas sp. McL0617 TaxID=3415675 RepID=UPI003CF7D16F